MKVDRRLSTYIKLYRFRFLAIIILAATVSLTIIVQAHLISVILDSVFINNRNLQHVLPYIIFFLIAALFRTATVWAEKVMSTSFAAKIKTQLRLGLTNTLFKAGPITSNQDKRITTSTLVSEGIETLDAYFSSYLPRVVLAALTPVLILIFVFPADLLSGFVLLFTAPVIPLFMVLIGNMANRKSRKQWKYLNALSAYFLDAIQGISTLKVYGQAESHSVGIADKSEAFRIATMSVLKIAFLSAFVLEVAAMISTAVIAVEVGLRLMYAQMGFREAIFILILAPEFYQPMRQLGASYHDGLSGISAAEDIFKVMGADQETKTKQLELTMSNTAEIRFNDISVTYPGRLTPSLDRITFSIEEGQRYFIIGPSGAGKSTLFNLLLGFIEPSTGTIDTPFFPLNKNNLESWREYLTWIPQKPYLFHRTVSENLRFVNPSVSDDEIRDACIKTELHDFIMTLEDQYETQIGESAARLSSGQAQRLALARAYLSKGRLLLFDEPTSHLDANLEGVVWKSIRDLAVNKTLVVITHKLHLIEPDDHILLISDGKIAQFGLQRDVSDSPGPYRELLKRTGLKE